MTFPFNGFLQFGKLDIFFHKINNNLRKKCNLLDQAHVYIAQIIAKVNKTPLLREQLVVILKMFYFFNLFFFRRLHFCVSFCGHWRFDNWRT